MARRGTKRRGSLWPAALSLLAAACFAAGALLIGTPGVPEPAQAETVPILPPSPTAQAPGLRPTRLQVPAIGVDTALLPLGLHANGSMQVPDDASLAGWYDLGPRPGQPGPAVLAGHVDSRKGPGVFYRLRELAPEDVVFVTREDGSRLAFRVTAVEQHDKDALPVERIWAETEQPVLRLITCGGFFDRTVRHYTDNIVVFAELVGPVA